MSSWSSSDAGGVKNKEDLRAYGKKTRKIGEDLSALFNQLEREMKNVCEGWDDDKNKEFMAQFVKINGDVQIMAMTMKAFADFIDLEVKKIEEYKSIRIKSY